MPLHIFRGKYKLRSEIWRPFTNETADGDGVRKQKWESYKTEERARRRKHEVENPFLLLELPRSIIMVNDLIEQLFTLYGTMHWTYSTADNDASLKRRFICPLLETMHIRELTGLHVAASYQRLAKGRKSYRPVCKSTLRGLHKLLKCAFRQAVVWGVLEHSPLDNIAIPKEQRKRMPVWNAFQVRKAVLVCGDDGMLSLAIQFAFACSLRMVELLALKWSDVDFEKKTVYISKAMQRISRNALAFIGTNGIVEILPCGCDDSSTMLVIKAPKTESSVRTVFLPDQLATQLLVCKANCETDALIFRFPC